MNKETIKTALMLIGAAAVGYAAVKVTKKAVKCAIENTGKMMLFDKMMKDSSLDLGIEDDCDDEGEIAFVFCPGDKDSDCEYCKGAATDFEQPEQVNNAESDVSESINKDNVNTASDNTADEEDFQKKARDLYNETFNGGESTVSATKAKIEKEDEVEELQTSKSKKESKPTRTKKERK